MDVGQLESQFAGSALEALIATASPGNVLPPVITVEGVSVQEGQAGTVLVEFVATIDAPPALPVSVHFATGDSTAEASDSDYQPVSGVLSWDVGDMSSRRIQVPVLGDDILEPDEEFLIGLTDPENAVLSSAFAIGTILSDDPLRFVVPPSNTLNELVLRADRDTFQLLRNGALAFSGPTSTSALLVVAGDPGSQDNFTIDFFDGNPIPTGVCRFKGPVRMNCDSWAVCPTSYAMT